MIHLSLEPETEVLYIYTQSHTCILFICSIDMYTVEPPNNGHVGDEHFVHRSEVVPSSEVEMYGQLKVGGKQFVHCREVVLLSECPLSEVLLYTLQ